MSYAFGKRSSERLLDAHVDLQNIMHLVMSWQIMDFTILETLRTMERQEQLVRDGLSKTYKSKHLKQADGYSHAVDVAPYPIDWNDTGRFYVLNGIIRAAAAELCIDIRTGADWDNDGLVKDQSFHDLPHVELLT